MYHPYFVRLFVYSIWKPPPSLRTLFLVGATKKVTPNSSKIPTSLNFSFHSFYKATTQMCGIQKEPRQCVWSG